MITEKLRKLSKFIKYDLWKIRVNDKKGVSKYFIKILRIIHLSFRGFIDDNCAIRASSLTYYTILSIIPIFALIFALARGFGFEEFFLNQLYSKFSTQENIINKIVNFSQNLLNNTRSSMIAGFGFITLFYYISRVIHHIEISFNIIWGINEKRSWYRKVSDYITIMILSPILIIFSSSINIYLTSHINLIIHKFKFLNWTTPYIHNSLRLFPFFIIWILFLGIYLFIPNTKIRLKPAILGSLFGSILFQIVQWFYFMGQIEITKYNAIYGSFAAIPLLLAWMQISWFILLLGAEISFSIQNERFYEYENETNNLNLNSKYKLSLLFMQIICYRFENRLPPFSDLQIAENKKLPIRITRSILYELEKANLIVKYKKEDNENYFLPAFDSSKISTITILRNLERSGNSLKDLKIDPKLKSLIDDIYAKILAKESNYNLPINKI